MFVQLACAGAVVATGAIPAVAEDLGAALAVPPDSLLLHVDSSAPAAFIEGAKRTLAAAGFANSRTVVTDGSRIDLVAESAVWLAARPGRRLIGMVRDSDAVVLQQLARDGGLRWLSIGHHGLGGGAAIESRHQMTLLDTNRGLAGLIAADLAAEGASFLVTETPVGAEIARGSSILSDAVTPASRSGAPGWGGTLAEALVLIAAGRWPDQPPGVARRYAGFGTRSGIGGGPLTSFVIAS